MRKLMIVLSMIFLSSCSISSGKYDVLSTKPLNLYAFNRQHQLVFRNAENTSSRHVLVVIPSGKVPTVSAAVSEILNKYNGDYLSNVEITNQSFQIMWIYHYSSWNISGDVVKIR